MQALKRNEITIAEIRPSSDLSIRLPLQSSTLATFHARVEETDRGGALPLTRTRSAPACRRSGLRGKPHAALHGKLAAIGLYLGVSVDHSFVKKPSECAPSCPGFASLSKANSRIHSTKSPQTDTARRVKSRYTPWPSERSRQTSNLVEEPLDSFHHRFLPGELNGLTLILHGTIILAWYE